MRSTARVLRLTKVNSQKVPELASAQAFYRLAIHPHYLSGLGNTSKMHYLQIPIRIGIRRRLDDAILVDAIQRVVLI